MARKRMLDPGIWASEDFSRLSQLAKLIWIGLISNADDEGRGKANSAYLKSQLFPYDDELPLKKIENCLKEISANMSIQFYQVDNKKYYQLIKWNKFQTINRPTPSQLPKNVDNPSNLSTFSDDSLSTHAQVNDNSLNAHELVTDDSLPKTKIKNKINIFSQSIKNYNNITRARVEEKSDTERAMLVDKFKEFWRYHPGEENAKFSYEIIDTLIEAGQQARSEEKLLFNGQVYDFDKFFSLINKLQVEDLEKLVWSLKNESDEHKIKNPPFYILGAAINRACER